MKSQRHSIALHDRPTTGSAGTLAAQLAAHPQGRRSSTQSSQSAQSTQSHRRMGSSIRHSQAEDFDFDPLVAAVQARKEKQRRREREREMDESTRSSSTANDEEDQDNHKYRVREAGQVATVLLEMRRDIHHTRHVPSALNERPELEQPERHHTRISRTTLQRAEKTKVMLNLRYFSMFQAQKHFYSPPKYPGVEGVYNPLQLIRNRRVRKKFHQPPQLSIKTIPYASEAFSKRKDKLIWQIDLDELAHDLNWRPQHWHDLINPRGELWFPTEENSNDSRGHNHKHRIHLHRHRSDKDVSSEGLTNMHDRLFQSGDEDSSPENSNSKDSKDSKDDLLEVPRARKRDIITEKIKRRRSKSPFKRNQSVTELSKIVPDTPKRQSSLEAQSQPQLLPTSSSGLGLLQDINIEPIHHERVTSNGSTGDLLAASSALGSAVHTRNPSVNASNVGLLNSSTTSAEASTDLEFEEYKLQNELMKSLKRASVLASYGGHSINHKREEYRSSINYGKLFQDYKSAEELNEYLKTSVLEPYEASLKEKSKRLQSIHNELATEFSTRIDKLLLLSDRTIGEVNTTLALEARKLTERYEKLGPLHRRKDALVSFSYWLLENFVVLLLWIIWIGFSIGRIMKFLVLFLWNMAMWLMR